MCKDYSDMAPGPANIFIIYSKDPNFKLDTEITMVALLNFNK